MPVPTEDKRSWAPRRPASFLDSSSPRSLGRAWEEAGWLAATLALLVVLSGIDLTLPSNANISGSLVLGPFLASVRTSPRRVIEIGALAVLGAVGLAVNDGSGLHASTARLAVVVGGTVLATQASRLRIRREQRLVELSSVAEAAQRAIIRAPRSPVGSVAVATWYQSSVEAASVGGDCFEALDTPYGIRLLIGDVRGHGLPSVRLAALVVGGFRTLAYLEADLTAVAKELDMLAARYVSDSSGAEGESDGEEFVTAVLVEVHGTEVTLANCGHPPPLLVDENGATLLLEATEPTPPLGLGSDPHLDHVTVPARGRVLLYTDGLIEARDHAGQFFDIATVGPVLCRGPIDDAVSAVMSQLVAHASRRLVDDVALLAFEPLPEEESGD